ncbi:hypothetical protein CB0940_02660 [Cercospora beticola]|uniref:Protein PET100, mitochondrial n=2 Tax=Cercospora TaxID=29002 RepID=A0A2G5I4D5_CERBT|nr:hypothetical protein CB0940_02660 [Cercospora beticola]XP_044661047.1 uncharacterized protein CKM354_000968300 [Cercospora kikuchii]PIA99343.1 hypothetical protein CB0940_02660 [Cercospora beticola]WPA99805.1 hypothetical protein RHO25_004425 [Cercospora beticola]CAK1362033.1 unnamed protein product [Cercospora beticola]GIZ46560.1 hypothetical protein CKM354_000968300 [Cercospora kikuchii]
MGGPNLEVFKFGMYIMFPIGFMYYFGINLDSRFSVPDFWPKKGQTHEIPFERDEIKEEIERLKQRRLAARARRLAAEEQGLDTATHVNENEVREGRTREYLSNTKVLPREGEVPEEERGGKKGGWFGWGK